MESSAALRSKVQGAMIYPIIMLIVSSAIVLVLMVAVVPQITEIFVSQNMPLPLNTRILIAVADAFTGYWHVFLVGMALIGVGFRYWIRQPAGRESWHRFLLRSPLFGPLIRQVSVARFAQTMGTMLQSGVPMLRTLDISKEVLGNVILVKVIDTARVAVQEGESLAVALRKSGHFPATVTHMIAVGERSGALEQMLLRIAEAHAQEVDTKLSRMTSMLEPLMLVVMGGMVAFIVFSILMPLMDMQNLGSY
jgi:general secretion pathway protein F